VLYVPWAYGPYTRLQARGWLGYMPTYHTQTPLKVPSLYDCFGIYSLGLWYRAKQTLAAVAAPYVPRRRSIRGGSQVTYLWINSLPQCVNHSTQGPVKGHFNLAHWSLDIRFSGTEAIDTGRR
jgi:hypothetical protein